MTKVRNNYEYVHNKPSDSSGLMLNRDNAREDGINNVIADTMFNVSNTVVPGGVDLSMTNGFRFGDTILSANQVSPGQIFSDGRTAGDITLRDLFALFPVSPGVAVAEFSGARIKSDLEVVLSAVYNRNPFLHGEALDRICRTSGGSNHLFFELADADDYSSSISLVPAINTEAIITGPRVKQVLPDRFVHPVHMMRRYLDSLPGRTVTAADTALGRIQTVDSTRVGNPQVPAPVSKIDPTLIQPPEGAGPKFFSGIIGNSRAKH